MPLQSPDPPASQDSQQLYRQDLRPLTQEEKTQLQEIRQLREEFRASLERVEQSKRYASDTSSYMLARAHERLEEAAFWAIRAITQ